MLTPNVIVAKLYVRENDMEKYSAVVEMFNSKSNQGTARLKNGAFIYIIMPFTAELLNLSKGDVVEVEGMIEEEVNLFTIVSE